MSAVDWETGLQHAAPVHADTLAAIHLTAFPPSEQWNANVMGLQLGLLGGFGLLHPDGGMVLARVTADEAEILTIAVMPALRRGGLGAALMRATMAECRARGAVKMFLEVAETNAHARALYARLGFVRVGTRRNYYPGGGHAFLLEASLTGLDPDDGSGE